MARAEVGESDVARTAVAEALDASSAGMNSLPVKFGPSSKAKAKGRSKGSSSGASSGRKSVSAEEQARKDFDTALASTLGHIVAGIVCAPGLGPIYPHALLAKRHYKQNGNRYQSFSNPGIFIKGRYAHTYCTYCGWTNSCGALKPCEITVRWHLQGKQPGYVLPLV